MSLFTPQHTHSHSVHRQTDRQTHTTHTHTNTYSHTQKVSEAVFTLLIEQQLLKAARKPSQHSSNPPHPHHHPPSSHTPPHPLHPTNVDAVSVLLLAAGALSVTHSHRRGWKLHQEQPTAFQMRGAFIPSHVTSLQHFSKTGQKPQLKPELNLFVCVCVQLHDFVLPFNWFYFWIFQFSMEF